MIQQSHWTLRADASWKHLSERYPTNQTCHLGFETGVKSGVFTIITETFATNPYARGGMSLSKCFVDETFCITKEGALQTGKTKKNKYINTTVLCNGSHEIIYSFYEILISNRLCRRYTK